MGNKLNNEEKKEHVGREYVHYCSLAREVEVVSYFIPNDKRFRQWFRKIFLISSNIYHRRLCVKSFRALEQDRAFHLTQHYYYIHPFSAFRFYWEIFMIFMFILQLITSPPLILLTNMYFVPVGFWIIEAYQFIAFLNIIIQFRTGYFEKSTRTIILAPKKIVKHYIKTFFIFDFIANIPVELIIYFLHKDTYIIERCLMLKIVLNIFSFLDYTEKFRQKRQYSLCICRLLQFIFILICGILWITAALGCAVYLDQGRKFTEDLKWVLRTDAIALAFSLGQTEFILYGYELYVHFVAVTFGFIMRNVIIAQIILLFKSYYSSQRKYSQLLSELKEYTYYKQLPKDLKNRLFDYYNFVFQHYYYNESDIWNLMSDKLKSEIDENLYKIWFEADMFMLCSPQLMQSIVLLLSREIYLATDIIYLCNFQAEYIYFLKCGTVALYDDKGKEIFHVQEGSFFSDSALILETEMVNEYTAIALEGCEVYKLHREDFREIIEHYPNDYKKILSILHKRKAHINTHPHNVLDLSNYFAPHEIADENEENHKKKA